MTAAQLAAIGARPDLPKVCKTCGMTALCENCSEPVFPDNALYAQLVAEVRRLRGLIVEGAKKWEDDLPPRATWTVEPGPFFAEADAIRGES
jgi:hypothetical protein